MYCICTYLLLFNTVVILYICENKDLVSIFSIFNSRARKNMIFLLCLFVSFMILRRRTIKHILLNYNHTYTTNGICTIHVNCNGPKDPETEKVFTKDDQKFFLNEIDLS